MTIDDCIYYETSIERTGCERRYTKYEHQQLAEWLEELKAKRNIGECAYKQGYNKAICEVEQFIEFFITKRMSYKEAKAILKELKEGE